MPNRMVHEVHALIVYGRPYSQIHRKKDAFSQRVPGIAHRRVKHRKYQTFDVSRSLSEPFPIGERKRIERVARWKGANIAEEYMVLSAHDLDDKIWDFDGVPRDQRRAIREYWESFCAWLVLNPDILKSWAGVDVIAGRINRMVNGVESWEEEPALITEYAALRARVLFLIGRRKSLREAIQTYGHIDARVTNGQQEMKNHLSIGRHRIFAHDLRS